MSFEETDKTIYNFILLRDIPMTAFYNVIGQGIKNDNEKRKNIIVNSC